MILQDSNSVFWVINVLDSGTLTQTVVSSGPATPTILRDSSNGTLWSIGITTAGTLTQTSVGSGAYVPYVELFSIPSRLLYNLQINPGSGGLLQTVRELYTGPAMFTPIGEDHTFFSGDIM
jgi:hypothetical protein